MLHIKHNWIQTASAFKQQQNYLQCKYTCAPRIVWFFSASPRISSTSLFLKPSNLWLLWSVMLFSMRASVVFSSKSTSSRSLLLGTWLQKSWLWYVPGACSSVYIKKISTSKEWLLKLSEQCCLFSIWKKNMYNSKTRNRIDFTQFYSKTNVIEILF